MTDESDYAKLVRYLPEDQKQEFHNYIKELIDLPENFGQIDGDFLGFIDDYINYAQILQRKVDVYNMDLFDRRPKKPLVVYDVGCNIALQHLVFDHRIHYMGIDCCPEERLRTSQFFRSNCTFIRGRFSELVESLKVDPWRSIGIANMSLLYGPGHDLGVFDQTFRTKFVL